MRYNGGFRQLFYGLRWVSSNGSINSQSTLVGAYQGDGIFVSQETNGSMRATLRPVITLNQNVKIIGGNGTIDNPYELSM